MAQHYWTEITWAAGKPPSKTFLKKFNKFLQNEDYDAPLLDAAGMYSRWRSPLLDFTVLLNVLHVCGHPCKGMQTQECRYGCCCGDSTSWQNSEACLDMLKGEPHRHLRETLRKFSPKLAKRLPSEGS